MKETYNKILNRGTEFLGLDLKYFASGAFWTALGQGINGILALLLTIAFANLLPKEVYGTYRYLLSLAGFLTFFTLTGANSAVTQAVAIGDEGSLIKSVKYQIKWNLMMTLATFVLGAYYLWHQNQVYAYPLFILGLFYPITLAFNTYPAFLRGKKEFRLLNLYSIWSTIIYVVSVFTALVLSKNILVLIIVYALSGLISNVIFHIIIVKKFKIHESRSTEHLSYGRKLTFIAYIGSVASQIDSIVLNHFWGPVALAVYTLSRAIPDKVIAFIKDIGDLGTPKLAQKSEGEIKKVFYKRILQGLGLGLLLTIGYVVLVPFVFKYLMPKYMESIFYSQIMAIGFLFMVPLSYFGTILKAKKLIKLNIISGTASHVIKILLYIILGIWGGILGLILAQVITYAITFLITIIIWQISHSKTIPEIDIVERE